jgi:hypothetical protein
MVMEWLKTYDKGKKRLVVVGYLEKTVFTAVVAEHDYSYVHLGYPIPMDVMEQLNHTDCEAIAHRSIDGTRAVSWDDYVDFGQQSDDKMYYPWLALTETTVETATA